MTHPVTAINDAFKIVQRAQDVSGARMGMEAFTFDTSNAFVLVGVEVDSLGSRGFLIRVSPKGAQDVERKIPSGISGAQLANEIFELIASTRVQERHAGKKTRKANSPEDIAGEIVRLHDAGKCLEIMNTLDNLSGGLVNDILGELAGPEPEVYKDVQALLAFYLAARELGWETGLRSRREFKTDDGDRNRVTIIAYGDIGGYPIEFTSVWWEGDISHSVGYRSGYTETLGPDDPSFTLTWSNTLGYENEKVTADADMDPKLRAILETARRALRSM